MKCRRAARRTLSGARKIGIEEMFGVRAVRDAYRARKYLDGMRDPVQAMHQRMIALVHRGQGWTGPLGPRSRRSDCMIANVVVRV
jgi:hypothetical protein